MLPLGAQENRHLLCPPGCQPARLPSWTPRRLGPPGNHTGEVLCKEQTVDASIAPGWGSILPTSSTDPHSAPAGSTLTPSSMQTHASYILPLAASFIHLLPHLGLEFRAMGVFLGWALTKTQFWSLRGSSGHRYGVRPPILSSNGLKGLNKGHLFSCSILAPEAIKSGVDQQLLGASLSDWGDQPASETLSGTWSGPSCRLHVFLRVGRLKWPQSKDLMTAKWLVYRWEKETYVNVKKTTWAVLGRTVSICWLWCWKLYQPNVVVMATPPRPTHWFR